MRFTRYTACAIALAASLSMPVLAQGNGSNSTSGSTGATGSSADTSTLREFDPGFNWGWLGLIGLAGLMGLRKQPDSHRTDTTRASVQR